MPLVQVIKGAQHPGGVKLGMLLTAIETYSKDFSTFQTKKANLLERTGE